MLVELEPVDSLIVKMYIPNLEPYTRYVMYVQAQTVSTSQHGAISQIVSFTTATEGQLKNYAFET